MISYRFPGWIPSGGRQPKGWATAAIPGEQELPCPPGPRCRAREAGEAGEARPPGPQAPGGRGGGRCRGRTPGSRQVTGIALTASPAARGREGRSGRRGHTCHPTGPRRSPGATGTRGGRAAPSPYPGPRAPPRAPLPPEPNLNCVTVPRAKHQRRCSRASRPLSARQPIVEPLRRPPRQSGRRLLLAGKKRSVRAPTRRGAGPWRAADESFSSSCSPAPSPRALLVPLPGERWRLRPAAMPEFLADPSVLTKEKLKSELIANNVSLPGGEQRKDVYVQLYLQHLTARNPPTLAQPDFSSDEEREPTPLGARSRGAAAAGRVSTAVSCPRRLGFPAALGPLSRPNGAGRRRPRLGERHNAPGSPHGVGSFSSSAEGGTVPPPGGEGQRRCRAAAPRRGAAGTAGSVPGAAGCSSRTRPALSALWSGWLGAQGQRDRAWRVRRPPRANWETFTVAWRAVS